MASPPRRHAHTGQSRHPRPKARHTTEREERKERGTPERSRPRRHRAESPEHSPQRPARYQKANRSPDRKSKRHIVSEKHESYESSNSGSHLLSSNALAQLDAHNEKSSGGKTVKDRTKREKAYSEKRSIKERVATGRIGKEKVKHRRRSDGKHGRRRVSGPLLEEGRVPRGRRDDFYSVHEGKPRRRFGRKFWILIGVIALLLIIFIPVGVVIAKKNSQGTGGANGNSTTNGAPSNDELKGMNEEDIPTAAKNTYLDPFTWYDTADFNVTYTNDTVGGISVMGLNSTWNDSMQANSNVPPLDQKWQYGNMPIRGVNLGGWLSLEPFITPSLFNAYNPNQGIVDEWTLTKQLGPSQAAQTLEKHYSQFITEQDFKDIQAAGFDHVRIAYSYWAVTTFPGDPYVAKISWRYLLRGIEYARKYGLRVNLDLHGIPGSQNGWNHSGRQGPIGWLNGTDGSTNAQRSLDLHTQLATFFAQPRYSNIIVIYGLVNEPKMTELSISAVVQWTASAVSNVRKAGLNCTLAFGDGFLGLTKWHGQLQGIDGLVLDAHEYTIFDPNLISLDHNKKLDYACSGWTGQMNQSTDTSTG